MWEFLFVGIFFFRSLAAIRKWWCDKKHDDVHKKKMTWYVGIFFSLCGNFLFPLCGNFFMWEFFCRYVFNFVFAMWEFFLCLIFFSLCGNFFMWEFFCCRSLAANPKMMMWQKTWWRSQKKDDVVCGNFFCAPLTWKKRHTNTSKENPCVCVCCVRTLLPGSRFSGPEK